ncbi:MAG: hypothetical protein ACODAE_02060 [Gemmatimonadota bacterium]
MMRTNLAASALLAAACAALVPSAVGAQVGARPGDASFSVWAGAATDRFERRLPLAPQLGLRYELAAVERLWLGVEATGLFVSGPTSCADVPVTECDEGTSLDVDGVVSGLVRVEPVGEGMRPYVAGLVGSTLGGVAASSTVLGGGVGVRWVRAVRDYDLSVEVRYRTDDRFTSIDYDHWEFMLGWRP